MRPGVGDRVEVVNIPETFEEEYSRFGTVREVDLKKNGCLVEHLSLMDDRKVGLFGWGFRELQIISRRNTLSWDGWPLGAP